MGNLRLPSFFYTSTTGLLQGYLDARQIPLHSISICLFISTSALGETRLNCCFTGCAVPVLMTLASLG